MWHVLQTKPPLPSLTSRQQQAAFPGEPGRHDVQARAVLSDLPKGFPSAVRAVQRALTLQQSSLTHYRRLARHHLCTNSIRATWACRMPVVLIACAWPCLSFARSKIEGTSLGSSGTLYHKCCCCVYPWHSFKKAVIDAQQNRL